MQIWPNQLTWLGVVAILVPVVIAIFSRRFTVVLGALFFALASVCILLAPANAAEIVAAGFYLGSLIVAIFGVIAHQKSRALQTEIDQLRKDVNSLSTAAGRRFVKELKENQKRGNSPTSKAESQPAP
jgi:uncharacterized membrane protein YccC